MKLESRDGLSVTLEILRYQFPDMETEEYDSNWLVVQGHVVHPTMNWNFQTPCLLTYEAAALAQWLERIANDENVEPRLEFIEPNISLEILDSTNIKPIRIFFMLESHPRWPTDPEGEEPAFMDIPVDGAQIHEAASALRSQLAKFPQRAIR